MKRRWITTLLLLVILLLNVLDALFTPVDNPVPDTLARYPDIEDCMDGSFEDYLWLQFHHAPQLIVYGCP